MLCRLKAPNKYLWNGIGGKIESTETPAESVYREVLEEANIDLRQAKSVTYAGIVSWQANKEEENAYKGMYTYIADLPNSFDRSVVPEQTNEGELAWQEVKWVCDKKNIYVVENIPQFLPLMLTAERPRWYTCHYKDGALQKLTVHDLPTDS